MAIEYTPMTLNGGPGIYFIVFFFAFLVTAISIFMFIRKREDLKISFMLELLVVVIVFGTFFGFIVPWLLEGNFSSIRGFIISSLFSFFYIKLRKKSLSYLDVVAMFSLLFLSIARLGCFLEWHCYGVTTDLPWGIVVDGASPVHPTQIYLSLMSFALFIIFYKLRDLKFFARKSGNTFFSVLAFYSLFRLILIEPIREGVGTTDGILRSSLLILMLLTTLMMLYIRNKRNI